MNAPSPAMRRVLIVSPHFPPVNAPDMQRARLALPHLRGLGWDPTVLTVAPERVEGAVLDPLLLETFPADVPVVRVGGVPAPLTRRLGFGSLWWRCGGALRRAGDALLARERFDLVFFSTTQFDAFTLGPRWWRRHRVPYVLDYQDPWVNDYYRRSRTRPPGGHLKFRFTQFTARRREPAVLRQAAAVVAVSAAYGLDLRSRYPWLDAERIHHLPFGTSEADFVLARRHRPAAPLVPTGDGNAHLVYAGRCGPDMSISLTVLLRAFARYRRSHPEQASRLRFHFIGTDYAPPPRGRYWALPIAEKEGVVDQVDEVCHRIPYFDALHYLTHADALVVLGSNDPSYSASKVFPYLFARRPLLTLVHESSLMLELAREQGIATSYGYPVVGLDAPLIEALVSRVHQEWFVDGGWRRPPSGDLASLHRHSAAAMAQRLASVFNHAVA